MASNCSSCGKRGHTKVRCPEAPIGAETPSGYYKRLYRQARKAGLCGHCRRERSDDKVFCEKCRELFSRRKRRKEKDNECSHCARPRVYGTKLCEDHRRLRREKHLKLKRKVFDNYGGSRCACCNESGSIDFLTIDHIDNDGAEHRRRIGKRSRSMSGVNFYNWLVRHRFPPGFQVLCHNCNCSKHYNGGVCAHKLISINTTA